MCVIIEKPAGKQLSENHIIGAAKANSHGFGMMYYDPNVGRIVAEKHLITDIKEIVKKVQALEQYKVALHFRIKTHGKIADSTCHPFKILDKKRHGMDMYFMHNGVISKVKEQAEESDTQAFNRQILQPILKAKPYLIKTDAIKSLIEDYIGGSKLLFMFGEGETLKFNERLGDTFEGMWVSNKSFVGYNLSSYYHGHGNYGSRYSDQHSDHAQSWYERQQEKNKEDEETLAGQFIKKGDNVWVCNNSDSTFMEEGEITSITKWTIYVKFKDSNKKEIEVPFKKASGESVEAFAGYYAFPSTWSTPKVENKEKDESAEKKPVTPVSGKDTEAGAVSNLPAVVVVDPKAVALDKKKDSATFEVSCEGITVDPTSRWGGAFVEDSNENYNGVTILDFNNMDAQARFNWFVKNMEDSFGMLQDLAERLVIDNIEDDYDEDVDDEEDDEIVSQQEILELGRANG